MKTEPSAQIDLRTAIQKLSSGSPEEAEEICNVYLSGAGRHRGDALHILALSLRAQGLLDEALVAIKRAKKKLGNTASIHNSLGLINLDRGNTKQAIASLRKAIKLDPNLAAAHANLGHAFSRIRRIDDAKSAYSTALSLNPELTDAYVNLALLLKTCGALETFESIAKPISNISSDDPGWQFVEGLLFLEKDQPEIAEKHFKQGLAGSPNSVPLLGNLGVALARQGKEHLNLADYLKYSSPALAREHIDMALLRDPDNAWLFRQLDFGDWKPVIGAIKQQLAQFSQS